MTTALDLITDVYQQAKIYPPGVALNAADTAWGMTKMNDMLDEWSNDRLACFANLEQSFPLVPNKRQYTIGPTGAPDITAPRPLEILKGPGAAYLMDANNNPYQVDVIEQDQWNQIGLLTATSDLPDTLFYNPQFPLGILNVFPTPLIANTMYFDARLQLADMPLPTTPFSLPPGYSSAIKSNLFLRLWPDYKSGDPPAMRVEIASRALAAIKRTNIKQSPAQYDSAVVSRAQGGYNIYTDSTRGRG